MQVLSKRFRGDSVALADRAARLFMQREREG